jgi:hypothetical protein
MFGASAYARRLAAAFRDAAQRRHVVDKDPWVSGDDATAAATFEVAICDGDDLPTGYVARVTIVVTGRPSPVARAIRSAEATPCIDHGIVGCGDCCEPGRR